MKKRVFITGSGGFSGRALSALLQADEGYELFGFDVSAPSSQSAIPTRQGDIRDAEAVKNALCECNPDWIIHLVALTQPGATFQEAMLDVSAIGTTNVLEAALACNSEARILVVGSSAEYGLVNPADCPIREDFPTQPISLYGISKVLQSDLAMKAWHDHGMHIIRTRTFNLVGPGLPDYLAPSTFARQIAEAETGRGQMVINTQRLSDYRDYVDVRDAVRAYWLAVTLGQPGQVYNVCSGQAVQVRRILEILTGMSACRLEINEQVSTTKPSQVPYQSGSHELITEHTGWQPAIPLEQSLKDLLDDWRRQVSMSGQ